MPHPTSSSNSNLILHVNSVPVHILAHFSKAEI